MRRRWYRLIFASALLVVAAVAAARYNAVDNVLTASDRDAFTRFLPGTTLPPRDTPTSYEDEIALVASVQRVVLERVPGNSGIALGAPREPADVLEARTGECYDRSRVIEKLLRSVGMRTRHVAVYSTAATGSALVSLLSPGVSSHALTEVHTRRGWLLVDSNAPWLSLDAAGDPVDAASVQADVGRGAIAWHPDSKDRMNAIFREPFTFVYGLYSRHGRFYPPFNPVPDVNYGELVDNFL